MKTESLIKKNFPLEDLNTFGISSTADFYIKVNSLDDLTKLTASKGLPKKPVFILGQGSNVLFPDNYQGLIIHSGIKGIEVISETEKEVIIKVGSGINWDSFVEYCVEKDWGGLENLSDIPGSIGASPVQNIGAYGVEIKDYIIKVEGICLNSGRLKSFNNHECQFGYRNSVFKTRYKNSLFISHVYYKLNKAPHQFNLRYGNIQNIISKQNIINIKTLRNAIIEIRRSKIPDTKEMGNAGSFFKNPVVANRLANEILKIYPDMPYFEALPDKVKIPAAWLIEHAGMKGYRKGNAGTHENHALIIVNYGNAKSEEIVDIAKEVQMKVKTKFNVELEPEVTIL